MNDTTTISQLNCIRSNDSLETKNLDKSSSPVVVQRDRHNISRSNISEPALKVLYRLKKADYDAYLVGGGVRDLLLERRPKDFDIVTDALPEDVGQLFRNSRLIGRRFQLVHVHFGKEIIEVATYRGHEEDSTENSALQGRHMRDGMLIRDNVFGTIEEDAWRRDFTINALYYNIQDFSVIDYTGGLEDLQQKRLRMIGDPRQRYTEDPVRMLRAVRFAAKLGFSIAPETEAPIYELADRLSHVPPARLFEEVLKLFLSGHAVATYELLRKYQLFDKLFPLTAEVLRPDNSANEHADAFIRQGLANTDARIAQDKPVTPAFLFSVLLWWPMKNMVERDIANGVRHLQAYQRAGSEIITQQTAFVSLPKRFSIQAREIWSLQPRLPNRAGKRAYRLLALPRFRAGYDFMLLRAESCEPDLQPICDWWTEFQDANDITRSTMLKKVQPPRRRGRRPRKKR